MFGQSTVLVVVDEAQNASGSIKTIDDGSTPVYPLKIVLNCAY